MKGLVTIAASAAMVIATSATRAKPLPTQHFLPLPVAIEAATAAVTVETLLARAAHEGIGAFVEKRVPNWPDR